MRLKGIAVFALVLLLAFLVIPGFVTRTIASTTTDLTAADGASVCPGTLGGTWEPGNNCVLATSYTLSSGDTLIVDTGVTLFVTTGGTMTIAGIVNVTQLFGTLGTGVINVDVGGVINNHNGIDVYGALNNYGTINQYDGAIYIGLYGGYAGTLNNYGVINQISFEGFAEITITGGGVLNNECGGVINNPSPGVIEGTVTQVACSGVPEFPVSALGPILLTGLLFPALLVMTRKFRRIA